MPGRESKQEKVTSVNLGKVTGWCPDFHAHNQIFITLLFLFIRKQSPYSREKQGPKTVLQSKVLQSQNKVTKLSILES